MKTKPRRTKEHRSRLSGKARARAFELVEGTLSESIETINAAWHLSATAEDPKGALILIRPVLSQQISHLKFALCHARRLEGKDPMAGEAVQP